MEQDVPICFLTAFDVQESEFKRVFPNMKIDGIIKKPVMLNELTKRVTLSVAQGTRRAPIATSGRTNHTIRASQADVVEMIRKGNLRDPGAHNILVYDDSGSFREVCLAYARSLLPENELLLLAPQYETVENLKGILAEGGVDVSRHGSDGTLLMVDAEEGYFAGDVEGTFKQALTLLAKARKENRPGLTWIGDMGSFLKFDRTDEMMAYELSKPKQYGDPLIKTVCCYRKSDFETLSPENREALLSHHFKAILVV